MGGLLRGTVWVGLSIVTLGFSLGLVSVGKDKRGRSGCCDAGDAAELDVGCVDFRGVKWSLTEIVA